VRAYVAVDQPSIGRRAADSARRRGRRADGASRGLVRRRGRRRVFGPVAHGTRFVVFDMGRSDCKVSLLQIDRVPWSFSAARLSPMAPGRFSTARLWSRRRPCGASARHDPYADAAFMCRLSAEAESAKVQLAASSSAEIVIFGYMLAGLRRPWISNTGWIARSLSA